MHCKLIIIIDIYYNSNNRTEALSQIIRYIMLTKASAVALSAAVAAPRNIAAMSRTSIAWFNSC